MTVCFLSADDGEDEYADINARQVDYKMKHIAYVQHIMAAGEKHSER